MIRIGCLGAARITPAAIIAPAARRTDVAVTAIAARDASRARSFATAHAIAAVADDYAALIARDDVDLVYNALPPAAHAPWTIAALRAGKHVVCEKPFCRTPAEAEAMVAAAHGAGRHLIEAYHYRHHALMARVIDIVRGGGVGRIVSAVGHFRVPIPFQRDELRWRAELGGGAMMDLGVYPLHALRTVFGVEPRVLSASAIVAHGVDERLRARLDFGGVRATIAASMSPGPPRAILAFRGDKGGLRVTNFIAPQIGNRIVIDGAGGRTTESAGGPSTYDAQLDHIVAVVTGAAAGDDGRDCIDQMRALAAIRAAAGLR